jgi:hypothetical protein
MTRNPDAGGVATALKIWIYTDDTKSRLMSEDVTSALATIDDYSNKTDNQNNFTSFTFFNNYTNSVMRSYY